MLNSNLLWNTNFTTLLWHINKLLLYKRKNKPRAQSNHEINILVFQEKKLTLKRHNRWTSPQTKPSEGYTLWQSWKTVRANLVPKSWNWLLGFPIIWGARNYVGLPISELRRKENWSLINTTWLESLGA